jgi:zinc protease
MGTADAAKAFTQDDLRALYSSMFRPDNAALLIVGDVVPAVVLPLLESQFGSWKSQGAVLGRAALPAPSQPARREVYIVDKPGAPQTQVRIGAAGVMRGTPDFFPIQVMNTILGGSFSSRLNLNLREKHGYTYGAGSTFDMRMFVGPFSAAAGVQTDKTKEALQEFFNELNGILQVVPADELARAKNYVALRFPGGFEATGDITTRLEDVLVYGLPDDYFSTYVQNIQAVTAADVQRVARKYIQPDRFAVVVVGDRKVIEPGIRSLNLGPIKEIPLDDVFASPSTR